MSNIEKRLRELEEKTDYIYAQPEWKHGWTVYQHLKSADKNKIVTNNYVVRANYQEAEDNDPQI